MARRRSHRWLWLILAIWIASDVLLYLAVSGSRPAATVIPTGSSFPVALDTPSGTERLLSSGNLSQRTTASKLAGILLDLGAQVSDFEDGTEYILTGRGIVVSLWLGDTPGPGHPDSLNVQLVLP